MKKYFLLSAAILFIFTMTFVSCKKSSTAPLATNADTSAAIGNDHTVALQSLNDANNSSQGNLASGSSSTAFNYHSNQIMGFNLRSSGNLIADTKTTGPSNKKKFKGMLGDSATLTPQSGQISGVLVDDFGSGVTVGGIIRKGIMTSHYFIQANEPTFVDTITFSNYYSNNNHIEGTLILTATSDSSMSRTIKQIRVTYPGGLFTTLNGTSVILTLKNGRVGSATEKLSEYGQITGVSQTGIAYTAITAQANALFYDSSCSVTGVTFPVRGVTTFNATYYKTPRVLDYGQGTCDRKYTVTIGTYVATITAP